MKNILYLVIIFTLNISEGIAQESNNLIEELKKELFGSNDNNLFLYQYLKCENTKVDSTIMIRAQQPDPEKVMSLLKEIMYTKNASNFESLKTVYLKHINNFSKEWSKAYLENFYACEQIQAQFNILKGFEIALKSLGFTKANLSTKQIFDFYVEETLLNQRLILDVANRNKLIQQYKVYADEFRRINAKAWLGGAVPFHYLDPFEKELNSIDRNRLYC